MSQDAPKKPRGFCQELLRSTADGPMSAQLSCPWAAAAAILPGMPARTKGEDSASQDPRTTLTAAS
eukprot:8754032-Alexandrium_andersonii.AAC.1